MPARQIRLGPLVFDPVSLAASLALGAVGGTVAIWLHLPLGMLLGSLIAVGAVAILGWQPFGRPVDVPEKLRFFFVPVIGVSIGGAFTPEILADAVHWWPSVLALLIYLPLALGFGFLIYTRIAGIDRVTAFFGAVPGGLVETVLLGEGSGADPQMLTLLQFLRLIWCILLVPIGFTLATGHAVGSAAGLSLGNAAAPIGAWDVAVLLVAAVLGAWGGKRLRLPAAIMTGPILLSALAHLAELTQTVPPGWLVGLTQLVVGTSLGARFAGMPRRHLTVAVKVSGLNALCALGLAAAFAALLAPMVGEPAQGVFLAFAPGGLAEMSLVALGLQVSVIYVTVHHVLRIVLSVLLAQILSRRLRA